MKVHVLTHPLGGPPTDWVGGKSQDGQQRGPPAPSHPGVGWAQFPCLCTCPQLALWTRPTQLEGPEGLEVSGTRLPSSTPAVREDGGLPGPATFTLEANAVPQAQGEEMFFKVGYYDGDQEMVRRRGMGCSYLLLDCVGNTITFTIASESCPQWTELCQHGTLFVTSFPLFPQFRLCVSSVMWPKWHRSRTRERYRKTWGIPQFAEAPTNLQSVRGNTQPSWNADCLLEKGKENGGGLNWVGRIMNCSIPRCNLLLQFIYMHIISIQITAIYDPWDLDYSWRLRDINNTSGYKNWRKMIQIWNWFFYSFFASLLLLQNNTFWTFLSSSLHHFPQAAWSTLFISHPFCEFLEDTYILHALMGFDLLRAIIGLLSADIYYSIIVLVVKPWLFFFF